MDPAAKRPHHADKVRRGVPQRAPTEYKASRDALSRTAVFVCCAVRVCARDCVRSCAVGRAAISASVWTAAAAIISAHSIATSSATLSLQLQQPLLLPLPLRLHRSSNATSIRTATSARSSELPSAFCGRRDTKSPPLLRAYLAMRTLSATGWRRTIRTTLLAAAVLARLTKQWIQRSPSSLAWNLSPPLVS